jgi:hypothetical protein
LGKAFLCGRARVSADPFCGETRLQPRTSDGLPADLAVSAPPPPPGLIGPAVEALIKATAIDFRIGGNRAYYAPAEDYVQVPPHRPTSKRSIGTEPPCTSSGIMP